MRYASLLVVVLGVAMGGCATIGIKSDTPPRPAVETISFGQAKQCRSLGVFSTEGRYPDDVDMQGAAIERAQGLTANKGGNAMVIEAITITSVAADRSVQTQLTVQGYVCNAPTTPAPR